MAKKNAAKKPKKKPVRNAQAKKKPLKKAPKGRSKGIVIRFDKGTCPLCGAECLAFTRRRTRRKSDPDVKGQMYALKFECGATLNRVTTGTEVTDLMGGVCSKANTMAMAAMSDEQKPTGPACKKCKGKDVDCDECGKKKGCKDCGKKKGSGTE